VESEMKMNEKRGWRECEHSSVLCFRGVSGSFLLWCSAFVIKFSGRLSQLQQIDSLYLALSVSVFFLPCFPSPSFFLCGPPLPAELYFWCCYEMWSAERCEDAQSTRACACVCVFLLFQLLGVCAVRLDVYECVHVNMHVRVVYDQ